MAFSAIQKSISDMLSNSIYEIPRNQRRYVWRTNNWLDLWNDLLFIIDTNKTDEEKKKHFIGSIVLKEEGKVDGINHYTIIDGQQRTITILLFLSAIMQVFKEQNMLDDFYGNKKMLMVTDLKNRSACALCSEYHCAIKRLITEICDFESNKDINKILAKAIIDKKVDKLIGNCIQFFYNKLSSLKKETLLEIRDALISMQFIEIIANTDEDSYTIFEILNARGQVLEDHELLKNYIMRYIRPQNQEKVDEVKEQWANMDKYLGTNIKRFFKHYASHKYKATPKSSIYKVILDGTHEDRNINALFEDIVLKTKYYLSILECDEQSFEIERAVFQFFKSKKAEQFRPIILSLMHQKDEQNISDEEYTSLINYIYVFYVCYNIIGEEKSNKLEEPIYKYAPILENNYSEDEIKNFKASLAKRLPSRDVFIGIFKNIGWSNHTEFYRTEKNKDRVKIILELLEQHIGGRALDNKYTIEHILPDSQSEKNAMIGNLLPLEERLNNLCKNKPLIEKLPIYKQSNYAITRNFAIMQESKSHTFDPEKRNSYLGGLLYDDILGIQEYNSKN